MTNTSPRPIFLAILVAALATGCSISSLVDSVTGEDVRREIRAQGLAAEAVVLEIWETGTRVNDNPVVGFRLELHAEGHSPWQAETRELISILDLPRIQPGAILEARYLEEDPLQVAIAWADEEIEPVQAGSTPDPEPEPGLSPAQRQAIDRILEEDNELGSVRNHDPERMSLAEAIDRYVAGLDALDLSDAPARFGWALARHRDAWHDSITFFSAFPDLRGELHDLFDQIRASSDEARLGLEAVEKEIWETWAMVEEATGN